MKFCAAYLLALSLFLCTTSIAQTKSLSKRIVVDLTGKGDFKSIQAALNSLSDSSAEQRIIVIRNGTYKEKIYIEKHHITLQGENRERTIITQAIARDAWRCMHVKDWGVATMNVDGNDITLINLTVINNYGQIFKENFSMYCPVDTVTRRKTITASSHQMALRTMNATRLKAMNCRFVAFGGDTVSPWNVEAGMFYFKDCILEGGVDFIVRAGGHMLKIVPSSPNQVMPRFGTTVQGIRIRKPFKKIASSRVMMVSGSDGITAMHNFT